jgi:hypothetical protein
MLGAIGVRAYVITLAASVVGGSILAVAVRRISIRKNLRRAAESGAIWVGLAQINAEEPGSSPIVKEAMAGTGTLYGSSFGRALYGWAGRRPVGGLLYVFTTGLRWEPRLWLGRGKARAWTLDAGAVLRVETARLPVIDSWSGKIVTAAGDIDFLLVDPDGLTAAIHKMKSA